MEGASLRGVLEHKGRSKFRTSCNFKSLQCMVLGVSRLGSVEFLGCVEHAERTCVSFQNQSLSLD